MADQPKPTPGPAQQDRPMRIVAIFTAREMKHAEIPRLIDFCSQAYGDETPGASLRVVETPPEGGNVFTIEATPGTLLKECRMQLRVHRLDDPQSDHHAIVAHMAKLDEEIGNLAKNSLEGAQSYIALVGTRLLDQTRIRSFLNTGALIGSALGALFIDPAAVIVTTDPGEWAEACEQSLGIEGAMAALGQR